jgi:hypothetical protein
MDRFGYGPVPMILELAQLGLLDEQGGFRDLACLVMEFGDRGMPQTADEPCNSIVWGCGSLLTDSRV